MGCVHSTEVNKDDENAQKSSSKHLKSGTNSLNRSQDSSIRNDVSLASLMSKSPKEKLTTAPTVLSFERDKKVELVVTRSRKGIGQYNQQRSIDARTKSVELKVNSKNARESGFTEKVNMVISSIPNGFKGEHIAAGWPSWLTSVAGEAVRGWLPRRPDSFEKLNKIGQGTYSSVYKARDLKTSKIVALKKVRFINMEPESVRFMAREIHILRTLDHPNVIKLEALVTSRTSSSLYLVFEYMEHDLTGLAAAHGTKFTEPQIKCYMHQLLSGLDHCHCRSILHRDIKGSNLLIDNNGNLKIADFGLAAFYNPDAKQQLTSCVVTLWYRPPELLLGASDYGPAVDLWSAGCILAELFAGKPIMPGRTEVEQLHKIFKLCGSPSEEFWRKSKLPQASSFKTQQKYRRQVTETFNSFPASALALVERLLAIEPKDRGTAASALNSGFFKTKPFACEPSSLPKYSPSKEYDIKLRDEEARRQREAGTKGHESEIRKNKEAAVGSTAMKKQQFSGIRKATSTRYSTREDTVIGYPLDRMTSENGLFRHGQDIRSLKLSGPILPGPVVARSSTARLDRRQSENKVDLSRQLSDYHLDHGDVPQKQECAHILQRPPSSQMKDNRAGEKEPTVGYGTRKSRIHYSGPLVPPGGSIEDMLKEHEQQIQQALRKSRLDKIKAKNNGK